VKRGHARGRGPSFQHRIDWERRGFPKYRG
jgi:hypothetical protein